MSRTLILASSGFGKTTSLAKIDAIGHIGLNPKETYLISVTSKPLPNGNTFYTIAPKKEFTKGNRYITNDPEEIAKLLEFLVNSPFTNVVVDDFNYILQDYYMENALKGGWDTPKKIGAFTYKIFDAIEKYDGKNKHIFVMAHPEFVDEVDGRKKVKMKTTGRMVDEYITPEGKFDITLFGKSRFDATTKKVVKEYITNEDEFFSGIKSPIGMFKELYIPNDLGYVLNCIKEHKD